MDLRNAWRSLGPERIEWLLGDAERYLEIGVIFDVIVVVVACFIACRRWSELNGSQGWQCQKLKGRK